MKHIQTNGRELILVEIPKSNRDYTGFYISESGNLFGINDITNEPCQCDLYANLIDCTVIGLLRELKPEQAIPYVRHAAQMDNPIDDLKARMRINNIDPTLNWLIIEKLK